MPYPQCAFHENTCSTPSLMQLPRGVTTCYCIAAGLTCWLAGELTVVAWLSFCLNSFDLNGGSLSVAGEIQLLYGSSSACAGTSSGRKRLARLRTSAASAAVRTAALDRSWQHRNIASCAAHATPRAFVRRSTAAAHILSKLRVSFDWEDKFISVSFSL